MTRDSEWNQRTEKKTGGPGSNDGRDDGRGKEHRTIDGLWKQNDQCQHRTTRFDPGNMVESCRPLRRYYG